MKLVAKIFLLFTITTAIELYLLLKLAEITNWWVTVAMILIPGLLGAWLARREGARAFRQVVTAFSTGHEPGTAILDGALVLMASTLLITPGVLTDLVGLLVLIPPIRRGLRRILDKRIRRAIERRLQSGAVQVFSGGAEGFRREPYEVIDADDIRPPRR